MTQQHTAGKPAQFDMFVDPANGQEDLVYSPSRVRRVKSQPMEEAEMLAHLTATGRYRILYNLELRQVTGTGLTRLPSPFRRS
jgi:DNA polymerase-3 subunit epsilon